MAGGEGKDSKTLLLCESVIEKRLNSGPIFETNQKEEIALR